MPNPRLDAHSQQHHLVHLAVERPVQVDDVAVLLVAGPVAKIGVLLLNQAIHVVLVPRDDLGRNGAHAVSGAEPGRVVHEQRVDLQVLADDVAEVRAGVAHDDPEVVRRRPLVPAVLHDDR